MYKLYMYNFYLPVRWVGRIFSEVFSPNTVEWSPPKSDGGREILGYSIEMYDLPTGNWVVVTQTEG